ncbi:MAG: plastocyanin/azurin family copper-binding protein [Dehalococcoidia bacterium]
MTHLPRFGRSFSILVATLVLLSALAAGPLAAPTAPARAADQSIQVGDNFFAAADLTIAAGDTVFWTNNGTVVHTVTAADGSWDSGGLTPGQSFSQMFPSPGTYPYLCVIHDGMSGTVTVVP